MWVLVYRKPRTQLLALGIQQGTGDILTGFLGLISLLDRTNDQRSDGDTSLLRPMTQQVMYWFGYVYGSSNSHDIIMSPETSGVKPEN